MRTRAQDDLRRAVQDIQSLGHPTVSVGVKKNYIRRVKDFPALVMTVGLAQALAFSEEKSTKGNDLAKAHEKILKHVASIMGLPQGQKALDKINDAQTTTADYVHYTRRVLAAWPYYRRLAVSMLDPHGDLQKLPEDDE